MRFDYDRYYTAIAFRVHRELYQIGRGEQGVLLVEPYKGELLPLWRFRTPELARTSADALYARYVQAREDRRYVALREDHRARYEAAQRAA